MVGNDVTEDMAAQSVGMQVFLLTDCLINKERRNIAAYPRGSFMQLMRGLWRRTEDGLLQPNLSGVRRFRVERGAGRGSGADRGGAAEGVGGAAPDGCAEGDSCAGVRALRIERDDCGGRAACVPGIAERRDPIDFQKMRRAGCVFLRPHPSRIDGGAWSEHVAGRRDPLCQRSLVVYARQCALPDRYREVWNRLVGGDTGRTRCTVRIRFPFGKKNRRFFV